MYGSHVGPETAELTQARTPHIPPPDPQEIPVSDPERMNALEERLKAAKARAAPDPSGGDDHYSMANVAWRMVIELVAGIVIGFGIGIGLDSLFGTTPIFLVTFILFGLAAGINVMMRTAKEVQEKQAAAAKETARAEEETADG